MSINHIEDYPTGDDTVGLSDPVDDPTVPSPNAGKDHEDPAAVSITHIERDTSRFNWRDMLGIDKADPDAAFNKHNRGRLSSGTEERPERWVHDQALQVTELVPTGWNGYQYPLTSPMPVSVAPKRTERKTIILLNAGTATVFIGPNIGTATPTAGFPLAPGAQLMMTAMSEFFASVVSGSPSVLGIIDQFRTDNQGN